MARLTVSEAIDKIPASFLAADGQQQRRVGITVIDLGGHVEELDEAYTAAMRRAARAGFKSAAVRLIVFSENQERLDRIRNGWLALGHPLEVLRAYPVPPRDAIRYWDAPVDVIIADPRFAQSGWRSLLEGDWIEVHR